MNIEAAKIWINLYIGSLNEQQKPWSDIINRLIWAFNVIAWLFDMNETANPVSREK